MTDELLDERRAWLEQRQTAICSTDTAKILGLSRYGSALTVYLDKVDPVEMREPSLSAWLGYRLQGVVGELYSAATGHKIRADNRFHVHRGYGWLGTHTDFRVVGGSTCVECKTRSFRKGWGEDGSQDIPVETWVQAQHEMAVMGLSECHVAVLFGFTEYATYPIPFDPVFWDKTLPVLDQLWHENVIARVPPEPTGHALDSGAVQRLNPDSDGTIRALPPEKERVVRDFFQARRNLASVEEAVEAAQRRVESLIGTADGIEGSWGRITWKRPKDSTSVGYDVLATMYRRIIDELLELFNPGDDERAVARLANIQAVLENAVSLVTTTKQTSRRINVKEA